MEVPLDVPTSRSHKEHGMNDQQRAAMQMAYETLERLSCVKQTMHLLWWQIEARKPLSVLREALAQPQGEWVEPEEKKPVVRWLWAYQTNGGAWKISDFATDLEALEEQAVYGTTLIKLEWSRTEFPE